MVKPEELRGSAWDFDYLIVTVIDDRIYKEIINDASVLGINREIILPLRIFEIPFFNFEDYIKIKNSNVSILSNYCAAGLLYHMFGLQFMSPTINMYTTNSGYFRFIQNLENYMKKPMLEVEESLQVYQSPRGRVGDVEWNFNHDIYFSTATERWQRGVERFNWDNYIVIMAIHSDEMAYRFDALPIQNKIGFYFKNLNLDSVVYLPEWQDPVIREMYHYNFNEIVNFVASQTSRNAVCDVNWMKVLLHQDDFRRIF